MIEVLCQCDGLPPHDHYMGQEFREYSDGIMAWGPRYDLSDIGRVSVPWKEVARSLSDALGRTADGTNMPDITSPRGGA